MDLSLYDGLILLLVNGTKVHADSPIKTLTGVASEHVRCNLVCAAISECTIMIAASVLCV